MWLLSSVKVSVWGVFIREEHDQRIGRGGREVTELLTENLDYSGGLPDFKRIDCQAASECFAIILDLDWRQVESRVCTQFDSAFK